MELHEYDSQADSVKIEDISTNDNNKIVLQRMRRNDSPHGEPLWIQNEHDDDGEDCIDFCPEGIHDIGWLGYFVFCTI